MCKGFSFSTVRLHKAGVTSDPPQPFAESQHREKAFWQIDPAHHHAASLANPPAANKR